MNRVLKTMTFSAMALSLALAGVMLAQRSADAALRAAIETEMTRGASAAIEQYQRVADTYRRSDPAVAAQALLRLAQAYEKLGDARAASIYEQIVNEFGNQKETAAVAGTRLTAIGPRNSPERSPSGSRVSTADGAVSGNLSADGRYMAFAKGYPANLAVRDLTTGDTRQLTHNASPTGWVGDALISPDGSVVAYRWNGGTDESTRLIRTDGTDPKILTRHPYGEELAAWSPDGRWIAAVRRNYKDLTVQLVLLSVADGTVRQLKSMAWAFPEVGGVSPDGRFLVYAMSDDEERWSVFALATNGSSETPLVAGSENNRAPRWTPDGKYVVYQSNRNGSAELWRVRAIDGRPEGAPEFIRAGRTDPASIGIASDGSFYYIQRNSREGAYLADFDPATHTASRVEPVTNPVDGTSSPALSPDGQFVAYLQRSQTEPGRRFPVIRSLAKGSELRLPEVPLAGGQIVWHPNSRSILGFGVSDSRSAALAPPIVRIDQATGKTQTVFRPTRPTWNTIALSPDGTSLFYTAIETIDGTGPGDLKRLKLVQRDLASGQEVDVHSTESQGMGYFGLTVSSDGKWLAYALNVGVSERALMILPANGGTPVEIARWPDRSTLSHSGSMAWTPDGRYLVVTGRCGPDGSGQLCAISRDGGPLRPVATNVQTVTSPMLSANGRRMAFTGSTEDWELWMIRGLFAANAVSAR